MKLSIYMENTEYPTLIIILVIHVCLILDLLLSWLFRMYHSLMNEQDTYKQSQCHHKLVRKLHEPPMTSHVGA